MLPAKKPTSDYRTLEEICLHKEELADALQEDSSKIQTLWNKVFYTNEDASRGEQIASLVSKGFMAFDVIMTIRKLMNTYGFLKGKMSKAKKRN